MPVPAGGVTHSGPRAPLSGRIHAAESRRSSAEGTARRFGLFEQKVTKSGRPSLENRTPSAYFALSCKAGMMLTHPKTSMTPKTPDSVGPELAHSTSSGPLESLYGLQAPSLSRGSWPLVSAGQSGDDQGRAPHPTEPFRLQSGLRQNAASSLSRSRWSMTSFLITGILSTSRGCVFTVMALIFEVTV